jgi:hypothetical protein
MDCIYVKFVVLKLKFLIIVLFLIVNSQTIYSAYCLGMLVLNLLAQFRVSGSIILFISPMKLKLKNIFPRPPYWNLTRASQKLSAL